MGLSEHERVEAYIYDHLGLEENDDMVSDNAFDRVCCAWKAYEEGILEVPDDWSPPRRSTKSSLNPMLVVPEWKHARPFERLLYLLFMFLLFGFPIACVTAIAVWLLK